MNRSIKSFLDRLSAAISIIVFSPLIIVISIIIRVNLGSPILFCQPRPGKDNQIFKFYKFRTMTDAKDAQGRLLPDEDRITTLGTWLRKTSLDELPQLLNVLKGDMSIIGPRPLLVRFLDFYSTEQIRRHEVLPGITGLAQVNGRNNVPWEKRFELDVDYIDNWSLGLDLKILLATIWKVIGQKDINQDGHATSEEFDDYMIRTSREKEMSLKR